jgi:hypothetical protein
MVDNATFEALMRRPGMADAAIRVRASGEAPPAALRGRARYHERDVWEVFVIEDSSGWPERVVYRLVDRMDDRGDPLDPLEPVDDRA